MRYLIRRNPFREMMTLSDSLDRVYSHGFFGPRASWLREFDGGLALDVAEKDEEYVVKASIPGIDPDDLEITYESNRLSIKGEVKEEKDIEEGHYQLRERRYGSFCRTVTLASVNADEIEASYQDGVLTLNLPKIEEVKPRKIEVVGASKMIEGKAKDASEEK